MRKEQFTINKERKPARCEICHQTDCFDTANGNCSRCQPLLLTLVTVAGSTEPEWKPIMLELIQQMTPLQIFLVLLLGGILIGLLVDVTQQPLTVSSLLAILISTSASLPLAIRRTKNLHPLLNGLLVSLTIAPLGWLLLAGLYWLIKLFD
ncbi:MAG: hypothetical protein AB1489_39930 [Acidobacteriota bacterium]